MEWNSLRGEDLRIHIYYIYSRRKGEHLELTREAMPISEKGISSRVFLLAFFLRLLNPRLVSGSFRHYLRNPWLQLPMALALPKTFRFLISTIAYCFSFHCRNRSKHKGLPRNYNMQKKGRPLSLQVSFGPLLPSFRFSVSSFLLEISCRHGLLLFSVSLCEPFFLVKTHFIMAFP